jgi:hypothetical protein
MAGSSEQDVALAQHGGAIESGAFDRARAQVNDDDAAATEAGARIAGAVGAAISAGASIASIAQFERVGMERARAELGRELLRSVAQATKRKREADHAFRTAIIKAARLLPHREIAGQAGVTHNSVRAIISRDPLQSASEADAASDDANAQQQHSDDQNGG